MHAKPKRVCAVISLVMACWAATGFWFDTDKAIASKQPHQKLSIAAMPFSFAGYAIFIAHGSQRQKYRGHDGQQW